MNWNEVSPSIEYAHKTNLPIKCRSNPLIAALVPDKQFSHRTEIEGHDAPFYQSNRFAANKHNRTDPDVTAVVAKLIRLPIAVESTVGCTDFDFRFFFVATAILLDGSGCTAA